MNLPLPASFSSVEDAHRTLRTWVKTLTDALGLEMFDRPALVAAEATADQVTAAAATKQKGVRVEHRLGRVPRGWLMFSPTNGARLWAGSPPDAHALYVAADGAFSCRLWVW